MFGRTTHKNVEWQPMVRLNRFKRAVAGWQLVDMEGRMTDLSVVVAAFGSAAWVE